MKQNNKCTLKDVVDGKIKRPLEYINSDLPRISGPAQRALFTNNIKTVEDLSKHSRAEVANFHGMGPQALSTLDEIFIGKGW